MMHVVPKWKITATFVAGREVTIWMSEHHLGNVLRTLASVDFDQNSLEQPLRLTVAIAEERSNITMTTTRHTVGEEP